jgi:periplasmic divalent cation tolerance protein
MSNEFVFVYSTFPDEASARRAAEALVRERLCACANLFPITSIYEWQGKFESCPETSAFFKTRRALAETLIAAARKLHPYSLPCFVILPVDGGSADYLAWIEAQTAPPTQINQNP